MTLAHVGYVAAVLLAGACLAVVGLLVLTRVSKDRAERRRLSLRAPVWQHVLALTTGEDDEVEQARAALLALGPAGRAAVEEDAFALVPKLRGSARTRLRDVLRSWGSVDLAVRNAASRSACAGAGACYRLGVLAEGDRRDRRPRGARRPGLRRAPDRGTGPRLLPRRGRRPRAARPHHRRAAAAPRLPGLHRPDRHRRGAGAARRADPLAAAGPCRGRLRRGARRAVPGRRGARPGRRHPGRAGARGRPRGALGRAQDRLHRRPRGPRRGVLGGRARRPARPRRTRTVRRAAARAIGLVGGPWGVPALNDVLYDDNVEVARAAANALRRCGATRRRRAGGQRRTGGARGARPGGASASPADGAGPRVAERGHVLGGHRLRRLLRAHQRQLPGPHRARPGRPAWPTAGGSTSPGTTSGSRTRTPAGCRC